MSEDTSSCAGFGLVVSAFGLLMLILVPFIMWGERTIETGRYECDEILDSKTGDMVKTNCKEIREELFDADFIWIPVVLGLLFTCIGIALLIVGEKVRELEEKYGDGDEDEKQDYY